MLRKVELFIRQGIVKEMAPEEPNQYGLIHVFGIDGSQDPNPLSVYTHHKHSFEKDPQTNKAIQPGEDSLVYFFLIPLEYINSDFPPGDEDPDAPLLAVNITTKKPYPKAGKGINLKRHPCTTGLTIEGDTFSSFSDENTFNMTFLFVDFFLRRLFHKNSRFYYGINDYGELTIIDTPKNGDDGKPLIIKPWDKILLKPRKHPHNEHFGRTYSPKLKGKKRSECELLVQKFMAFDEWSWEH